MAHITFASGDYWIRLGPNYDRTHHTPISLLVGAHGCGDTAPNYLSWAVAPYAVRATQSYIAASLGGRDGSCWTTSTDTTTLLNAIADLKTHFNINPRRVVLTGYDSGGALAYHTAFYNANLFAGVLALLTQPFASTTGPDSQSASIAAAAWKFNIVHIAHLDDEAYPIATVQSQRTALTDAGFPVTYAEHAGTHDATTDDAMALVAHMDDPWLAPAP
jgi:poly(3-hydroxybutyrate) depolymerase